MIKQEHHFGIDKSKEFLAKTILSFADISNEAIQRITDIYEPVQYDKNYSIIKADEIAQYVYFICRGIVKVSYIKEDKEIIDWFAEEGVFFGDMLSYQTKQSVVETYESIEKVELLRARYSDVEALLRSTAEVETAIRKIQGVYHAKYVQRTQSIKALPAEKKYHLFMAEYASYANRIPLKYIANYLGMTPETLSRIRANYDKSNQTKK